MNRPTLLPTLILTIIVLSSHLFAGTVTQTYTFDAPRVERIDEQTVVILDGARTWGDTGAPLLPQAPVKLLLPPGEEAVSISIKTGDPVLLGDGYAISPMQPHYPLSKPETLVLVPPDPAIYDNDLPYPESTWDNLQTQFLCGHGLAFATLNPVVYRPLSGELSYYPWIEVTVQTEPTTKALQIQQTMLKRSEAVQARVQDMVQNPQLNAVYGPELPTDPETYDLLVVTDAEFVQYYQDYIDYKNRSGLRTVVLTVADILNSYSGMDNQDKIRNAIIDYYQTYDITYVFLAGDNEQIPARSFWCIDDNLPADLYYAGLDGTWNDDMDALYGEVGEEDLVAEVFVGRSCADNETEIANFVNKAMKYQTAPVLDEVETALMTGEDLGWSIWAWEYKEEIRLGASTWGYTTAGFTPNYDVETLYEYPGDYWTALSDLLPRLNEGPTLVNHLGHANWDYVMKFGRNQINDVNFTNDGVNHNYFIGYSQGCICGDFTHFVVDCILEEFTTIEHGAVAFVGNSRYGWGSGNTTNGASQHFDREFFDAIFAEGITNIGWTQQDSKEDNIWAVPGDNIIRWCYYDCNLFGDPTMDIWTARPDEFSPTFDAAVLAGATSFEVTGIGEQGALVTISQNNEIIGQGTADASGTATVTFDQAITELGELTLMITAHDWLPYAATLLAIPASGPYVVMSDYLVEDGGGNGNNLLDYAETVGLSIDIDNLGVGDAQNVDLALSSADELVTINDATASATLVGAGATLQIDDAFNISLVPEVEDGYEVAFAISATDGDSTWITDFTIPVHAPVVVYTDLSFDDGDNNLLDPGETADLEVTVENLGSCNAEPVTFTLTCDNSAVTIDGDEVNLSSLTAGGAETVSFSDVTADPSIVQGVEVVFTVNIETDAGYQTVQQFETIVGDVRYRPSGPDAYGYYAYDSNDGQYAPEYQWTEIAPVAGGHGTDLNMGEEEVQLVDLPFTFRYYGVDYDQISIASQGWISFDEMTIFFPLNICIPHIVPPNNAVYGFWDELNPAEGGMVITYHDTDDHRFIVEWFTVAHDGNPALTETFQITLYDPAYTNSQTGDGEIVVHYNILSGIEDGFAIGMENAEGTDGIQYVHNSGYDEYASPLEDNMSIRYTTDGDPVGVIPPQPVELPKRFGLDQNYPNPFNPETTIRFGLPQAIKVELAIYNIKGQLVQRLVDGWRNAGYHEITFDAAQLSSGIYVYRLQADGFSESRKMILIK